MPDDTREIAPTPELATRGALAISRTAAGTFTVAPQNMGELIEFAKLMGMSSFCVRPAFRGNPGACLAVALQAFRCGGDPFAWANKAYIVKNKDGEEQISYEAQLIHALVNSSSVLQRRLRPVYEGDGQNRRCRIVGWIKGESEPLEYESPTIGAIKIKNSPLWASDPDQQLFYYSSRAWARRHVPEILLGIYAPEDFGEIIDATPMAGEAPRPRLSKLERFEAAHGENSTPDDKPFFFTDQDGEIREFDDADEAAEPFGAVLVTAAHTLGEDGVNGIWESNGRFLSALRDAGRADLADELSVICGELLDKARAEALLTATARAEAKASAKRQVRGDAKHPSAESTAGADPAGSSADRTPAGAEPSVGRPAQRGAIGEVLPKSGESPSTKALPLPQARRRRLRAMATARRAPASAAQRTSCAACQRASRPCAPSPSSTPGKRGNSPCCSRWAPTIPMRRNRPSRAPGRASRRPQARKGGWSDGRLRRAGREGRVMRDLRLLDAIRVTDREALAFWGGWAGDETCGAFMVPSCIDRAPLKVVASSGEGWDHVSVSRMTRCPNWPEMEQVAALFFRDDEAAMQLHVPASDHINNHPYCLHWWRPHKTAIPRPPSIMVGRRDLGEIDRLTAMKTRW